MKTDTLEKINTEDYQMGLLEEITANAVRLYLIKLPRKTALKLMQGILKGSVMAWDENSTLQDENHRTEVDGQNLSSLIDISIGDIRDTIGDEMLTTQSEDAAAIMAKVIDALERIKGEMIVQNVSPAFLDFLADCHRALCG